MGCFAGVVEPFWHNPVYALTARSPALSSHHCGWPHSIELAADLGLDTSVSQFFRPIPSAARKKLDLVESVFGRNPSSQEGYAYASSPGSNRQVKDQNTQSPNRLSIMPRDRRHYRDNIRRRPNAVRVWSTGCFTVCEALAETCDGPGLSEADDSSDV